MNTFKKNNTAKKNNTTMSNRKNETAEKKKKFQKEVMRAFLKYGYPLEEGNHEITFKTSSGVITFISIKTMRTIK